MKSTNNPVVKVDRQQGCSCLELVCGTYAAHDNPTEL